MFCSHCGSEVNPEAVICIHCGCAIHSSPLKTGDSFWRNKTDSSDELVDTITQRIHINGIIWIVIAILQVYIGLAFQWFVLLVGILNLLSALADLKFAKEFENRPFGLLKRVKPLTGAIITLLYNLLIGGVVGVVGSVYYLIAVRQYVLDHESEFQSIENKYAI